MISQLQSFNQWYLIFIYKSYVHKQMYLILGRITNSFLFQVLNLITSIIERDETTTGLRPENIFKNRNKSIIPGTIIVLIPWFSDDQESIWILISFILWLIWAILGN